MDRIEFLPLASLRESPFNPRQHYPEADLAELAESIASQGVLQPIVVRPLPDDQADIEHTHELIFGHRRFRAAQMAELEDLPCIVRAMSDREAAIAQTHENAKRADVTPFEEADSFAHLMHQHGLSADQVAAAVGKSRSYVYGRLKLHNAAPVVRQAFAEQGLSAKIALELARIPNPKLQGAALKLVRYGAGEWLSTRDAKRALKHRYVFDLTQAPFDLGDPSLVFSAGACHHCPRMSLNDPDLATEPGTFCIDQACHDSKLAAHRERYLDDMARAGHTVLEGEQAKAFLPSRWDEPKGYKRTQHAGWWGRDGAGQSVYLHFEQLLERAKAAGIEPPLRTLVVLDPTEQPVELIRRDAFEDFLGALGLKAPVGQASHDDGDDGDDAHDPTAHWSPAERLTRDRDAWSRVKHATMQAVRHRARTVAELRLVLHVRLDCYDTFGEAGVALGLHGDDEIDTDALHAWIDTASPDQLAELLVAEALDEALGHYTHEQDSAARRVALAASYGVDVLAAAQAPDPASTPSPAARAPEGVGAEAPAAPKAGKTQKTKGQKIDAGGAAAVEPAEAGA